MPTMGKRNNRMACADGGQPKHDGHNEVAPAAPAADFALEEPSGELRHGRGREENLKMLVLLVIYVAPLPFHILASQ